MYDEIAPKSNNSLLKNFSDYTHHLKCASGLYNINLGKNINVKNAPLTVPPDIWQGDAVRGNDILQGLYSFYGQRFHSINVLWEPQGYNDKWLSSMHGFDMLRDLKSIGGDRARHHARYLISDWLEQYSKWHPLAWRHDIMSRRIVHWLSCYSTFCASADESFSIPVLESLKKQSKYLTKNVKGYDLLYSAKALIYAGIALGHQSWCNQSLVLMKKEISSDILIDGGHKTRSPEKHLVFLQNLLDIRSALNTANIELPDTLQHTIKKMTPVLRCLRQNDGGLSIFHGGGESKGSLCDMVLGQSGISGRPAKALGAMGYDRLTQGRTTIVMDTGSVTNEQKYTGLLAFEFSSGKDRIVVNCGAWAGHPSWQEALYSTAAHSTITVEKTNAINKGRQAPAIESIKVQKSREEQKGINIIEASHDGYLQRFGTTHRRSLILKNNGATLQGSDVLSTLQNTNFAVRFHLHPSISTSTINNGSKILLRTQSGQGWEFFCDNYQAILEESVYVSDKHCDAPRRSQQITINGTTNENETEITWLFKRI